MLHFGSDAGFPEAAAGAGASTGGGSSVPEAAGAADPCASIGFALGGAGVPETTGPCAAVRFSSGRAGDGGGSGGAGAADLTASRGASLSGAGARSGAAAWPSTLTGAAAVDAPVRALSETPKVAPPATRRRAHSRRAPMRRRQNGNGTGSSPAGAKGASSLIGSVRVLSPSLSRKALAFSRREDAASGS